VPYTLIFALMGVKFSIFGPLAMANFTRLVQRVAL